MLKAASAAIALQILAWTPAWACTGQVGASIFQDTFADDSGGWNEDPPIDSVQPPAFVFALGQYNFVGSLNQTFNATDGDYCMDVVLPPPISANNVMGAGIMFWATDYANFWAAILGDDGSVLLFRQVGGVWSNAIFNVQNAAGFNSAASATNSLRVTALNGVITVYLNGNQLRSVKAQAQAPNLSFGILVEDQATAANVPPVNVTGYSVTAGK